MPIKFTNPRAFAPFYSVPVAFYGVRPDERRIKLTLRCSVTEDVEALPEASAPSVARTFNVSFPRVAWTFVEDPQIGEWMCMEWTGAKMWLKASAVNHLPSGDIALVAEWKPGRVPPWSR